MSKRHFYSIYNKIDKYHSDIVLCLLEISKKISDEVVDPDYLEEIKLKVKPMMDVYTSWSYSKFLIDKSKEEFDREYAESLQQVHDMQKNLKEVLLSKNDESVTDYFISRLSKQVNDMRKNFENWEAIKVVMDCPNKRKKLKKYFVEHDWDKNVIAYINKVSSMNEELINELKSIS